MLTFLQARVQATPVTQGQWGRLRLGNAAFQRWVSSGSHRSNSEVLNNGAGEVAFRSTGCLSGGPGLHPLHPHSKPLVVHNRLQLHYRGLLLSTSAASLWSPASALAGPLWSPPTISASPHGVAILCCLCPSHLSSSFCAAPHSHRHHWLMWKPLSPCLTLIR